MTLRVRPLVLANDADRLQRLLFSREFLMKLQTKKDTLRLSFFCDLMTGCETHIKTSPLFPPMLFG